MLECFGEEETASVTRKRLIIDPGEKIFVQHVEQEEGCKGQAVDDGGDDRVAKRDNNQQRRRGEECTPIRCPRRVLDLVDRARGRAKQSDFDIVKSQRHGLKEAARSSRKSLEYDETRYWNKQARNK